MLPKHWEWNSDHRVTARRIVANMVLHVAYSQSNGAWIGYFGKTFLLDDEGMGELFNSALNAAKAVEYAYIAFLEAQLAELKEESTEDTA